MSGTPRVSTEDTVDGDDAVPRPVRASEVARGVTIGRYVVLDRLGAGGMGVVYAAYDAELDRRVAIKLMHGDRDARRESRLIREARAMARLSHPNVVTVHDAGLFEGQVFVAMAFVDGQTLGRWAREPRPWREVIDVMLGAGRGLAAAHAARILHRDFKPDNVMIDRQGRACVLDFGLAATPGTAQVDRDELLSKSPASLSGRVTDDKLSKTGHVMGTPAYLAPELHLGLSASEHTDQFAYCVALYEALYGRRPFAGQTIAQLALNVTRGLVEDPPDDRAVPRALARIVRRGLATEASARYPSMEALLADLEGLRRPPRRWAYGAVGGAGLLLAAAWIARPDAPQLCAGGDARAGQVWSTSQAEALGQAFAAAEEAWLPDAWAHTRGSFDDWVGQWRGAYRTACESRHVRREWSADLLDRAVACLDGRMDRFEATVALLAADDPAGRHKVVELSQALGDPAACADPAYLLAQVQPPSDETTAAAVASLRGRLATVSALTVAGQHDLALARLEALEPEAVAIGYGPLLSEVHGRLALLVGRAGDFEREAQLQQQAYFEAAAAGDDARAVKTAADLVVSLSAHLERHEQADTWLRHARAGMSARVDDPRIEADVADAAGSLARRRGDYELAAAEYERAMALTAAEPHGARHTDSLFNAAAVQLDLGRPDEALALMTRGQQLREGVYGDSHPILADTLSSMGYALKRAGHLTHAAEVTSQALVRYREVYGEIHPSVAGTLHNLGAIELADGELAAAERHLAQARKIRVQVHGPDHPAVAASTALLGSVAEDMGEVSTARARYQDALQIFEARLGPDHPHVGSMFHNLGTVEARAGDYAASLAAHERALEIREAKLGPDHPDVAMSLDAMGNALRRAGRPADAVKALRRALRIEQEALGLDHPNVATTRGNLGAVLTETDPKAAIDVLREAIAALEKAHGTGHAPLATPLTSLGISLWATGDAAAAEVPLRRALRLREGQPGDPLGAARTRLALARALRAKGDTGDEAQRLATAATALLEGDARPEVAALRDEIAAFSATRR